jgi:hypothetical protein
MSSGECRPVKVVRRRPAARARQLSSRSLKYSSAAITNGSCSRGTRPSCFRRARAALSSGRIARSITAVNSAIEISPLVNLRTAVSYEPAV